MIASTGITAPATVPEGTTAPIEVQSPGSSELTVVVGGTGERLTVTLDKDGKGSFVLPSTALDGEEIAVIDSSDPSVCAQISVVPATGA